MLDTYSGATRVIFIVGDPIAQVKAPAFATRTLRERGADAIVVPAHVRPQDLAAFMEVASRMPADPSGFDLVVNATPMGMAASDPLPVNVDALDPGTFVGDVVTMPAVPPLIEIARSRGLATMTGMGMFEAVRDCLVDFYLEAR